MAAATILLQLGLLLFHQFTTLFDLFPFNNVRQYTISERLLECGVNGLMMMVPILGFYFHIGWMMIAALVIYPVLLTGEYLNWWHPYFFGATDNWQKTYDRVFCNTIVILPRIKTHPVPNLEHMILHGLTFAAAILTYIRYFSMP